MRKRLLLISRFRFRTNWSHPSSRLGENMTLMASKSGMTARLVPLSTGSRGGTGSRGLFPRIPTNSLSKHSVRVSKIRPEVVKIVWQCTFRSPTCSAWESHGQSCGGVPHFKAEMLRFFGPKIWPTQFLVGKTSEVCFSTPFEFLNMNLKVLSPNYSLVTSYPPNNPLVRLWLSGTVALLYVYMLLYTIIKAIFSQN